MLNVIYFYRVANWLHRNNFPILPTLIEEIIFFIYNCKISASATIGRGSKFAHGGNGCFIHPRAVIGRNCIIGANVVIDERYNLYEVPRFGNNVFIGDRSKIVGAVRVGHNVIIESNSLVLQNVSNNSLVEGVPAKVIFVNESNYMIPAMI